MDWRIEMEKVAVLPVPDCACAITSRPWIIGKSARCWIADGFSKSEKMYENAYHKETGKLRLTVGIDAA